MLNTQQQKELSVLLHEYTMLSNKNGKFTRYDEARAAYLQTAISTVKAGGTLKPTDSPFITHNQEEEARAFQKYVLEARDMTEGAPMNITDRKLFRPGIFCAHGFLAERHGVHETIRFNIFR